MNSKDIKSVSPPDDTGSYTLVRYEYQAAVAFQQCLKCFLGEHVKCVIMEHFEDFLVQYKDYWDFCQIKTRNANLGPWTLSAAIGGLTSLYRAYDHLKQQQVSVEHIQLSLLLEGAIKSGNLLESLCSEDRSLSEELVENVAAKLKIDSTIAVDFLSFVIVIPQKFTRDTIHHYNEGLLRLAAPNLKGNEVAHIYQQTLTEIKNAMQGERLQDELHKIVSDQNDLDHTIRIRIQAKTLDRDRLKGFLNRISETASPLLKRFYDREDTSLSVMVQKLIAANANDAIVRRAKSLRANAVKRQYELAASNLYLDFAERIEDVSERIGILNDSIVALCETDERPAILAWNNLLERLMDPAVTNSIDPNELFNRDPFLLMGLICEIADQCNTDWGVPLA